MFDRSGTFPSSGAGDHGTEFDRDIILSNRGEIDARTDDGGINGGGFKGACSL